MNQSLAIVINFAREIFFDDSEDENEETVLEQVDNFAELTVPSMSERQFEMHFRMNPETFEDLLYKIHSINELNPVIKSKGQPPISLEKQTMILIWCLSNLESFRSVADRFGVSKSTCWSVLYRSCRLFLKVNMKFQIISWPSGDRAISVMQEFSSKKMPGVIGAIDGSHIRIVAPKEDHNSFINRKSYHSVLLQGVCDSKMLFTDVYAGEAGSLHDYTLFKRSDLYSRIKNNSMTFPNDSHLRRNWIFFPQDI